jgi:hypothetical protein
MGATLQFPASLGAMPDWAWAVAGVLGLIAATRLFMFAVRMFLGALAITLGVGLAVELLHPGLVWDAARRSGLVGAELQASSDRPAPAAEQQPAQAPALTDRRRWRQIH